MNDKQIVITENENFITVLPLEALSEESLNDFKETITAVTENYDKNVVLDLVNVDYLYSNAVSSFIRLYKELQKKQRALVIINVSGMVKNVLSSVNMDKVISIFESFEEFYQWQLSLKKTARSEHILKLKREDAQGIAILSFYTEDSEGSPIHLSSDLGAFLGEVEPSSIVLDFHNVIDFETNAITSIVNFANRIREKNGRIVIAGLNSINKELFDVLDMAKSFQFSADSREAVKLLES